MRDCFSLRGLWVAALVSSLAACGGGGGGGADGGSSGLPSGSTPATNDIGARMSAASLSVERDIHERGAGVPLELRLLVDGVSATGYYYYGVSHTSKAITGVGKTSRSDGNVDLQVTLMAPGAIGAGTYDDSITVEVCLDQVCNQPALGSPFVVPVKLTVGFFAPTEAGLTAQPQPAMQTLEHDLVAAAYSTALDAVVMVATTPTAALHVYDLATGRSRSIALASAPTSVAVSPNGLLAAVGHDAAVSLVDLGTTPTVKRFPVSTMVGAVVLDASRRIFAFDGGNPSWMPVHWVDTAVGTDNISSARLYGNAYPVLHPAGDRIYFAERGVSPGDIARVSLDANGVSAIADSPYHGEYEMCGQVWTGSAGTRLYTACGNIFSASSDASLDMRYAGSFALSPKSDTAPYGYLATAVSDNPTGDRLVVLEQDRYNCDPRIDQLIRCFTRVASYGGSSLDLQSRNVLAPVTVGADRFAQMGRYVFHRADGRAVLLSELRGAPATASMRLSMLP